MTEKQPQLKSAHPAEAETATDRTVVDAAHTYEDEKRESTPPDSEPPEFSPGKFSRIEIPLELRKEMLQAKLPRLAPEFFQDTLPPNGGLEAPPPPSDASTALAARRRVPIIVACVIGAVFVLALGVFRMLLGRPEPTPGPTSVTDPPAAPTHAAAPVTAAPIAQPPAIAPPPVISQAPAPSAPPTGEIAQPPHVAAPIRPKASEISKPTHSALTSASRDTPAPPVTQTPSAPTTYPINPAPARSSWFHK